MIIDSQIRCCIGIARFSKLNPVVIAFTTTYASPTIATSLHLLPQRHVSSFILNQIQIAYFRGASKAPPNGIDESGSNDVGAVYFLVGPAVGSNGAGIVLSSSGSS